MLNDMRGKPATPPSSKLAPMRLVEQPVPGLCPLAETRTKAEEGDAQSQNGLGEAFHSGKLGLEKDEREAVKWYRKAAGQNHARAQYNLGSCYYAGQGLAKDQVEGYKWWLLAAARGDPYAKSGITRAEDLMTGDQIAEGKRLAQSFASRGGPPARWR